MSTKNFVTLDAGVYVAYHDGLPLQGNYRTRTEANAYLALVATGKLTPSYTTPTKPDLAKPYSNKAPTLGKQDLRGRRLPGAIKNPKHNGRNLR